MPNLFRGIRKGVFVRRAQKSEFGNDRETSDISSTEVVIGTFDEPIQNGQNLNILRNKDCKLWCQVHSTGQGYLQLSTEIDPKSRSRSLASTGTVGNASVLQVVLHERSGPRKDLYNIKFQKEECYLFCDENDNVTIGQGGKKTAFDIVQDSSTFYRIQFNKDKILAVGSDDRLVLRRKNRLQAFTDPACLFAFALV